MSSKISIGPPQLALHQANSVLVTQPDGQIRWPSKKGFYFLDTRVISAWQIYLNGDPWELLNSGVITHYAARIFLINPAVVTQDGKIKPQTVGLTLSARSAAACTRIWISSITVWSGSASHSKSRSGATLPTYSR